MSDNPEKSRQKAIQWHKRIISEHEALICLVNDLPFKTLINFTIRGWRTSVGWRDATIIAIPVKFTPTIIHVAFIAGDDVWPWKRLVENQNEDPALKPNYPTLDRIKTAQIIDWKEIRLSELPGYIGLPAKSRRFEDILNGTDPSTIECQ